MKKKRSVAPSKSAKDSQPVTPPFVFPPLTPSVLTQSTRRHRANPGRGYSDRGAIEAIRKTWQQYRQLRDLTAWKLREHLVNGLQDLSVLPEETQKQLLDLWQHVPDDPLFWRVIRNVEARGLLNPSLQDLTESLGLWNGKYFHKIYGQHRPPVPPGWVQAALNVVHALLGIKALAVAHIEQRSHLLLTAYKEEKKRGKARALIAAFHEGLPAQWVEEERLTLQYQQVTGTPEEQQWATSVLREIGEVLAGIGSGGTERLSPRNKSKSKQDAARRSKAVARLWKKFEKWQQVFRNGKKAYQQTVEDFKQNSRIKDSLQKRLILQAFTNKYKKTRKG